MRCPCRKKSETTDYAACCGPYHDGTRIPPTAEALMRSRYAAFAMENVDYLIATWHPSKRPAWLDLTPGENWLSLRVIGSSLDGDGASVEFIARSRVGGSSRVLHEVSHFAREDGAWFYLDGVVKQR